MSKLESARPNGSADELVTDLQSDFMDEAFAALNSGDLETYHRIMDTAKAVGTMLPLDDGRNPDNPIYKSHSGQ